MQRRDVATRCSASRDSINSPMRGGKPLECSLLHPYTRQSACTDYADPLMPRQLSEEERKSLSFPNNRVFFLQLLLPMISSCQLSALRLPALQDPGYRGFPPFHDRKTAERVVDYSQTIGMTRKMEGLSVLPRGVPFLTAYFDRKSARSGLIP